MLVVPPKSIRNKMADITLHLDGVSGFECSQKNLGVTFDPELLFGSYKKHFSDCFFHLWTIAKIRKMLSVHDVEKLVHTFFASRLDYCNALLSGCANASLKDLQINLKFSCSYFNENKRL